MDKPRLLIVEDDVDLAEMLNAYFSVQHYEVLHAASGEEALALSQQHTVALIILDIHLPDIDGYEVCHRLRAQRRTQDTPVIFLTGKRDRTDLLQGLELGVVDYITKPFDIQELRLRIRNAITRSNRQALTNPTTNLPETGTVNQKLAELIVSESPWTILQVSIARLSTFRELYGFVAADDVLRSMTLMIRNAVREYGAPSDYIGHIGAEEFIIITQATTVTAIQKRIEGRIAQNREYFYPMKDREKAREAMAANRLQVNSSVVHHTDGPFADLDALKKAMTDGLTEIKDPPAEEEAAEATDTETKSEDQAVSPDSEQPEKKPGSPTESTTGDST